MIILPNSTVIIEKSDTRKLLPHRWPWRLISEASHNEERTWSVKTFSFFNLFFLGHFPGKKVLPGVIILECIEQVAAICAKNKFPNLSGLPFVAGMDGVKFRYPVKPGDTIVIDVKFTKARHPFYFFYGKVTDINGKVIAEVKEIKGCAAEENPKIQPIKEEKAA